MYREVEVTLTIKMKWTVREDSCREMYGTDIDSLSPEQVIAVDLEEEQLYQSLFESENWSIVNKSLTMGDLQS